MYVYKKFILSLSVLGMSGILNASKYDGTPDIGYVEKIPAQNQFCSKKYQVGIDASKIDYRALLACQGGERAAQEFAQVYAHDAGGVRGYFKGYALGLYRSYMAGMGDLREFEVGSKLGQEMDVSKGRLKGEKAAGNQASSTARNDAISRFEAVINTGREPDPTVRVPKVQYDGISNGYSSEGLPMTSQDQLVAEQAAKVGTFGVYGSYRSYNFLHDKEYGFKDVWTISINNEGRLEFTTQPWIDTDGAWKAWQRTPEYSKADYANLDKDGGKIIVEKVVKKDPATGLPVVDPVTGQPVMEDKYTPVPNYYRNAWKEGFAEAYAAYASFYFSKAYHKELNSGFMEGLNSGEVIGKQLSRQKGLVEAYNTKYRAASVEGFNDAFRKSYTDSFNSTFKDYLSSPKLGHVVRSFEGEIDDGVFTRGEAIRSVFEIVNKGGADKVVNVKLVGGVKNGREEQVLVKRLSSSLVTTSFLAQIVDTATIQGSLKVGVSVDGVEAYDGFVVNNFAEIRGAAVDRIEAVKGRGAIKLQINNPTSKSTPSDISVELSVNGSVQQSLNLGTLSPKSTQDIALGFDKIDPFTLIKDGAQYRVRILMSGMELHDSSGRIAVRDERGTMVQYFSELAKGKGTVPVSISAEDRMGEVMRYLQAVNLEEIRQSVSYDSNPWKSSPDTTLLGVLRSAHMLEGQISTEVQAHYTTLGRVLDKQRMQANFSARDDYRKLLESFAGKMQGSAKKDKN